MHTCQFFSSVCSCVRREWPRLSLTGVGWLKAGVLIRPGALVHRQKKICYQGCEKSAYHLEKILLTVLGKKVLTTPIKKSLPEIVKKCLTFTNKAWNCGMFFYGAYCLE